MKIENKTLKVIGVNKSYPTQSGPKTILKQINLKLEKGQKIAILGKNGSGKSTLIRLIGGLEEPDSGQIIKSMTVSWPLGYNGGTQGSLSGLDNIAFLSRIYGENKNRILKFVSDFSGLGEALNEPVKTFSAGMRGKLDFSLSLAFEFDCFLIDEGLGAGDISFIEKCRDAIKKKKDCSLIMVSHSEGIIKDFCDYGYVLEDNHLLHLPSLSEALDYYKKS